MTHSALARSSGTPMLISWSNLPARRNAGSKESGRFVAPITMTGFESTSLDDMSRTAAVKRARLAVENTDRPCMLRTVQRSFAPFLSEHFLFSE